MFSAHIFEVCTLSFFDLGAWQSEKLNRSLDSFSAISDIVVIREVSDMLETINHVQSNPGIKDKFIWWKNKLGVSVSNSYADISANLEFEPPLDDSLLKVLAHVWKSSIPHSIKTFCWRLIQSHLPNGY